MHNTRGVRRLTTTTTAIACMATCVASGARAELGGTVTRTEPAGTLIMPFDNTT